MELQKSFSNFSRSISSYLREVDGTLFATVVAILFVSALNIYGIGGLEGSFLKKQILFSFLGIGVMVVASFFNYRYLKNYSFPVLFFYFATIGLLLFAFLFPSIRGSRAWIVVGGLTFEPSELMKLCFIIVMAKYFSQRHIHINQFQHIVVSGIYFAIPMLIILAQPDLGSASLLAIVWCGILLAAGMNKRHLFLIGTVAILGAYMSWIFALKPYQKERLMAFVDPYQDPTGYGYNIIQSKIAIGSGSWLGNGVGQGTQSTLGFLPEAHNDFAFAALTEQLGWAGAAGLLSMILLIVYRILAIGRRTHNNFAKLFCLGFAIMILTHVFVNAGVNLGLLPITGIPFSFLSYGGSHLMSLMIGLGIVLSIKRYG